MLPHKITLESPVTELDRFVCAKEYLFSGTAGVLR